MEQALYNVLTYREFDKIVKETYPDRRYRYIEEEECANDSDHAYDHINGTLDEFEEHDLKTWDMKYNAHVLLNDLVRHDKLPAGNYLITVCW